MNIKMIIGILLLKEKVKLNIQKQKTSAAKTADEIPSTGQANAGASASINTIATIAQIDQHMAKPEYSFLRRCCCR